MVQAYDLVFGAAGEGERSLPDRTVDGFTTDEPPIGWIGSFGPALGHTWPRGPLTGLPMMHAITLLLPAEYRHRAPDLVAVAFFQGDGQFVEPDGRVIAAMTDRVVGRPGLFGRQDPFLSDLAQARDHPHLERRTDLIDGAFALVWLTQPEYDRGPTAPPPDVRRSGTWVATDDGCNAWDDVYATAPVWLEPRADPNAGIAPAEDGAGGYQEPYDADGQFQPWAEELASGCHLGGTSFCDQAIPDGLTPYYLELEEIAGLNFGTGSAQIDLKSDAFDWACA